MSKVKRTSTLVATAGLVAAATFAAAPAAQARAIDVDLPLSGTSTVKKTGDVLTIPKASIIKGKLDLQKRVLTGNLRIPVISTTVTTPIGPAAAKIKLAPQGKTVATFRKDNTVVNRVPMRIKILELVPEGAPASIVAPTCRTLPFTLKATSTNKFSLERKLNLLGTFRIPAFENCDLIPLSDATSGLLTSTVSGPFNTVALKAGPAVAGS